MSKYNSGYSDRQYKQVVRETQFSGLGCKKSVLTLPGPDAICVKQMLEHGVIDHNTRQVWFERDVSRITSLMRAAADLRMKPQIIQTDILHSDLEGEAFDLVNLDLEEGFKPELGNWICGTLSKRIVAGADLFITLVQHSRQKRVIEFKEYAIDAIASHGDLAAIFGKISDATKTQESARDSTLVCSSLDQWKATMVKVALYKDIRIPMLSISLLNMTPSRERSCFPSLISGFQRRQSGERQSRKKVDQMARIERMEEDMIKQGDAILQDLMEIEQRRAILEKNLSLFQKRAQDLQRIKMKEGLL